MTSEAPAVDTKQTGTRQTFTLDQLQSIPSARDPWVILQQTAGIAMDRENIGGNMSGQQSNYVSRGGNPTNNKWSLDGVDITDMSATGASPAYYDFDSFQEMTINTGGVDVTQQTGGVGINLVTKSGTDKFRGSSRFFLTDESVQGQQHQRRSPPAGCDLGQPDPEHQGLRVRDGWADLPRPRVGVGRFRQADGRRRGGGLLQADGGVPGVQDHGGRAGRVLDDVSACLNTDRTLLQQTNLKAEVQLFKGNRLSIFNNFNKKERNARGASTSTRSRPPRRRRPSTKLPANTCGTPGRTRPTSSATSGWSAIACSSTSMRTHRQQLHARPAVAGPAHTQPTFVVSTGMNGRSAAESVFIRPVNSVTLNSTYFLPAVFGADHSFKFGGYWRDSNTTSINHTGGYGTVRFPTATENDCPASPRRTPTTDPVVPCRS